MSKQTWLNEQTDLKRTTQFHAVLLCLYVADPATFLALNIVLGTLLFSENSLFIQLWEFSLYYYLIHFMNVEIQSLNFFYKKTTVPL